MRNKGFTVVASMCCLGLVANLVATLTNAGRTTSSHGTKLHWDMAISLAKVETRVHQREIDRIGSIVLMDESSLVSFLRVVFFFVVSHINSCLCIWQRNTLIDRLKAKPGDGHTTSELQHLDNRGLTEMAEATSSNATFWELARAILNLEPKYRQVISNEKIEDFSLWSIEEMRNTIIAVLEREAQIDVKALQAMSSNQLVGIIPRRLQRAREREHILERVKYSTPEYTQVHKLSTCVHAS